MYQDEIESLKKANLYRNRSIYCEDMLDLASNDYLGFAEKEELLDRAYQRVKRYKVHSPKASQLINGYHPIHKEFEEYLSKRNSFEACVVVGSGFLANISLIEALPRRGDLLLLDEEYHASGILASKLPKAKVEFFRHNDSNHLRELLKTNSFNRSIIAVEGVYSMGGDLLNQDIFNVADEFNSLLIVDEAHSSGVMGENFLGIFEEFSITPKANHIKMGTLGKALGSYGAYILASREIIEFLLNRSKAIIYATAPSLFDIALSHEAMLFTEENIVQLRELREKKIDIVHEIFKKEVKSLILKLDIGDSKRVLEIKKSLFEEGILIGAIRYPTVKSAILRVILRLSIDDKILKDALIKIESLIDDKSK